MPELLDNQIAKDIKDIVFSARENIARQVNNEMLMAYWQIGKRICHFEESQKYDEKSARTLIIELSAYLTKEIGKGFSRSNLFNMRRFYKLYPSVQSLTGQLSWTHYCELIAISDEHERSFYEKECIHSKWSVRELKRQISTSLFERLLLSKGEANKETVLSLAKNGNEYMKPMDILKDPYVFEFLNLPEEKPVLEKDLERALLLQLEHFLLELGRGFMFVGSQQRITLGNKHYYVDLVFYNKILRAYVLIDLKINDLVPEHFGQMNMYVNYYNAEVNDEGDNPPIGILLCKGKDEIVAEYAIGGLSTNIFASTYVKYIPEKEQLIKQMEYVLRKNRGGDE
ncbi:PDDEXK nuclease domain-containing protein [Succinispira mobilis]|uniref:PDDEXK nuclease domain-containing protein n=1 Tax=Succinispira mobilis TaxID=78120 RepID=UPI00037B18A0|nr:PDDEXK nuclease domain-containing protein [Succinispira mobilis]